MVISWRRFIQSSADWDLSTTAPSYFHLLLKVYIPTRSLLVNERRLMVPSQRGTKSLSRTFLFSVLLLVEWSFSLHPECRHSFWQHSKTTENSSLPWALNL